MLNTLIQHFGKGKKSAFAALLGVSPQTISSWLSRNSYDAELIYAKCIGVSASWLLSGKGDTFIDVSEEYKYSQSSPPIRVVAEPEAQYKTGIIQPDPPLSLALVDLVREKDKQITTQAEEIGRLKAENERLREETQKQSRHERGLLTHDNVASRP